MRFMVTMTDEQFETIYEALRLANHPYSNSQVAHVVAMEAKAWDVVEKVKAAQT